MNSVLAPNRATQQEGRRFGALVLVAMVFTGLTMRVAVTSVGAVLTELESGLHISAGAAGVITTLPVICFAAMGSLAPRLAHRFGEHRVVVAALLATTIGLLTRAFAASLWLFALLSILALAGGAVTNVLMPALVKRHFPDQIGRMTAVYTTALAVGATAGAGLTVPISDASGAAGGWRVGIASWAALSAVALLPWLPTLRDDRPDSNGKLARVATGRLLRSRLAWALTLMFAFQSMQAYIAFGWFTHYFRDAGLDATHAGLLVAFYSALSIPVSMVIPSLAVRGQRPLVIALALTSAAAYVGMLVAPIGGAWLWMLLGGVGSGMFPLALTMVGLRSRDVPTTAALSAFAQSAGYLIAGTGPLVIGYLLDLTHESWTWPFVLLLIAAAISGAAGWYAGREAFVDDEIAVR